MVRPRPVCGTEQGYQWHLRHQEPTCLECRAANNARQKARRSKIITCRECGEERKQWARHRCVRCYERRRREQARTG